MMIVGSGTAFVVVTIFGVAVGAGVGLTTEVVTTGEGAGVTVVTGGAGSRCDRIGKSPISAGRDLAYNPRT